MTGLRHIAVIDIGKTNAKLALVDLETQSEIAVVTRPNAVLPGPPWSHFDVERHWSFILDALTEFQQKFGVDGISVTTHGASVVLLDAAGKLAAPMMDYEDEGPDALASEYDAIRPKFAETGSPRLSGGLNIGAQLFWQFRTDPQLYERTHLIVTYPQFWGFRLTGVAATDVTSLGCHTDLWNPSEASFSSLVDRLKISHKIAPALCSTEMLGAILPEISARTGLDPSTPVVCGIHDSNASLYPHVIARSEPFSVVSTGTWVITMSMGALPIQLDPQRDTLINVNALGQPVNSARFMGGREYELIHAPDAPMPTQADVTHVLDQGIMLLPSVEPRSGPFQGLKSRWKPDGVVPLAGVREVALSFYLALMTNECLCISGARGEIIVEGPFARNEHFLAMLEAATGRPVLGSSTRTGTSIGAALLFGDAPKAAPVQRASNRPMLSLYQSYVRNWRHGLDPF